MTKRRASTAGGPRPEADAWHQVSLWWPDWRAAEQAAVRHLGPLLTGAEESALVARWWFTRKSECWRVRWQPHPGQDAKARASVLAALPNLAAQGYITAWAQGVYEPETRAFGGRDGMVAAHGLFSADSRHILDYLRRDDGRDRAEIGVLLPRAMLAGAGLDPYEQGDVWDKVAAHRPASRPPTRPETRGIGALLAGRATDAIMDPAWPAAFRDAGKAVAWLSRDGRLTRGQRAVLAHHILFAWNRAGIPARHQALIAQAAASAIFDHEHGNSRSSPEPGHVPARVIG